PRPLRDEGRQGLPERLVRRAITPAVMLLALFALAGGGAAQQNAPFRSGASTVAVYTTVPDAAGQLVPDLDRDRFEVYDNGAPQAITTFASTLQPITIVVLLDRSLSMLSNFALVEKAAGAFVDRLSPADKA